jgi:hypothetical protein
MNLGPPGLSYYKIIRACTLSFMHHEYVLRPMLLSRSICVTLIILWITFCDVYLCIFFFLSLPLWSTGLISQFHGSFLQSVGFLGRLISSSQSLYLNTGQHKQKKRIHKHPYLVWDSNPRSRLPSQRRQYMLRTTSDNVSDVPTEIRTDHLLNTSRERYRYTNPLGEIYSKIGPNCSLRSIIFKLRFVLPIDWTTELLSWRGFYDSQP